MASKKTGRRKKPSPASSRRAGGGWHLVNAADSAGDIGTSDADTSGDADAALDAQLMHFLAENPEEAERVFEATQDAVAEFVAAHGREPSTAEMLEHIGLGPADDEAFEAWLDGLSDEELEELAGPDLEDDDELTGADENSPGRGLRLE